MSINRVDKTSLKFPLITAMEVFYVNAEIQSVSF